MEIFFYFGLVVLLALMALWKFRIGSFEVNALFGRLLIILFAVFTLYIYYASVNAIDSVNYETRFKYIDTLAVEVDYLFSYFIRWIKNFTDDYQIFRGVIGFIYLIPIFTILKKEKNINQPLLLLLCILFPFIQNIVALRYTMASAIVVFALYLYIKSGQTGKGKILTLFALTVSSMIHDTNILYLLMFILFLVLKRMADRAKIAVYLFLIDVVLIFALRIGVISNIVNALIGDTNTFYLEIMETAGIGFMISIFLQLSFLFLLYRAVQKNRVIGINDFMEEDILLLNYCAVIFIPVYSVNVMAFRLFRGILLLDFLVFSRHYYLKKKDADLLGLIGLEVVCMLFDANGIGSFLSIFGGI